MSIIVREKNELSMPLPGGVWTRTGFVVFDTATEDQLCKAVSQLSALNLSSAWALGDLGVALQNRKLKQFGAEALALREKAKKTEQADARARLLADAEELETVRLPKYTHELAQALGVDEGYWRNCVSLARFWEPACRHEGLSPEHHAAAMRGAGGVKGKVAAAQKWIEQATKDALSVSELRKKVCVALATSKPPSQPPETNPFQALDDADQWAISNKDMPLDAVHGATLRVRFAALIAFTERLKAL